VNPDVTQFETSCFNGVYVTGDITPEYLAGVEAQRNDDELSKGEANITQLDLNLATAE
jgi:amidophosphoribosyltransferase